MAKDWLIRTKSKQLLGPVSKQKIIECIEKGSLKGDDEICKGNGYWFFIREKELVDKYVFGPEIPPFNPISEAEDVVSAGAAKTERRSSAVEATAVLSVDDLRGKLEALDEAESLPDDDDLDFPEPIKPASKKASGKKQVNAGSASEDDIVLPDDDDLAYPDLKKN